MPYLWATSGPKISQCKVFILCYLQRGRQLFREFVGTSGERCCNSFPNPGPSNLKAGNRSGAAAG
jgi:hypothetical protein